ncbi:MAG: hypothetical protein C4560_13710 [Nitrospiraceae bacterium]|nr:MAG: hypothetical protein C4560_13710 [Nitrospiraceae bacterium]
MKNSKFKIYIFAICILQLAFSLSSCGYRLIGSGLLPFNSVTIKPVQNRTYEPRLEERLHNALAKEFINQGIEVRASGGDIGLEPVITAFQLGAIGAIDNEVKEQSIIMNVDIKLTDRGKITEFKAMESPIKITFQSTGTVTESVARKETATDKACREIAKEIVGRIILTYAK